MGNATETEKATAAGDAVNQEPVRNEQEHLAPQRKLRTVETLEAIGRTKCKNRLILKNHTTATGSMNSDWKMLLLGNKFSRNS